MQGRKRRKWIAIVEHIPYHHAQRPYIDTIYRMEATSLDLRRCESRGVYMLHLGRHETRSANLSVICGILIEPFANTKVTDLDPPLRTC